jgi:hypothetical protein
MTTIDDFFNLAKDPLVERCHPRLAEVERGIEEHKYQYQIELFHPEGNSGLYKTNMFIRRVDSNDKQPATESEWNEELNSGLIRLRVRAIDQQQETLRFAFGLRDALKNVESEFGNGYFNAVLLDLVEHSNLDCYPEIKEVLKYTYHDKVEESKRYHRCRDTIAFQISGRARELTKSLGYAEDEAKSILSKAIAKYIDSRFSVSSRREMGLL